MYFRIFTEVTLIRNKKDVSVFGCVFFTNLLLFAVKLYIGLSSNSISIYSDGINNLFDGLSCVVAIICIYLVSRLDKLFEKALTAKTQQLLSLALSMMIFFVGAVFLYNSAERLMYPTPVWFTVSYFYVLSLTAVVKLLMFFLLKKSALKLGSEVIRIMSLDSLTDFFITSVTVLTLYLSRKGSYSFDAVGGIVISIFILISAVKSFKESLTSLLSLPEKESREKIESIINDLGSEIMCEIDFSFAEEKKAYLKTEGKISEETLEALREKVYNETGIKLYVIK